MTELLTKAEYEAKLRNPAKRGALIALAILLAAAVQCIAIYHWLA